MALVKLAWRPSSLLTGVWRAVSQGLVARPPGHKEIVMDRRKVSTGLILTAATLGLAPHRAWAQDSTRERLQGLVDRLREGAQDVQERVHEHVDNVLASVTVSFGAGLNTAQPGNAANHHILPREIRVRKDGVVNFVVAGFHQIIVFAPGVVLGQIVVPAAPALFIYDPAPPSSLPVHYLGIRTTGGPPPGIAATSDPSNSPNRVESVSFANAGSYLVICNVRPHFLDGMTATIKVS
jgi:hypothetical protein